MNLQDTRNLIAFHYWARNRMLEALDPLSPEQFTQDLGGSFSSVRNTVVHALSAERIWLSRWMGESPPVMLTAEMFPDLPTVRRAWSDTESKLRALFDAAGEDGIQRVIGYKTLAGIESQSILWQMLQHVVNHATYHRGQVTNYLRQLGCAPPKSTDLIAFYRENP